MPSEILTRASAAFGATYWNSGKTMSLYVAGTEESLEVAVACALEDVSCEVGCAFGTDSDFCSAVPAQAISAEVDARAKRNKEDFI